jgi:WD40 repeat protein
MDGTVCDFVPRKIYEVCTTQADLRNLGGAEDRCSRCLGPPTASLYISKLSLLCLGTETGEIISLNVCLDGRKVLQLIGAHPGRVTSLCEYDSFTTLLASGSTDGTVKLWNIHDRLASATERCLQTLYGHSGVVTCIVAVEQGLVTGGKDGKILLWCPGPASSFLVTPQLQSVVRVTSSKRTVSRSRSCAETSILSMCKPLGNPVL